MRRITIPVAGIILAVAACAGGNGPAASQPAGGGGGGEPTAPANGGNTGVGGNVIDPQPPGHAKVSVDGVEYTFESPVLLTCRIGDGFSYSFFSDDGLVTLVAGAQDLGEHGWGGNITFTVTDAEPDPESGEQVFVTYVVFMPDVAASTMAFEGNSMSFSGPMLKQTPGSVPPGEDAGTGTISVTCP